jgi:hypothetical protein
MKKVERQVMTQCLRRLGLQMEDMMKPGEARLSFEEFSERLQRVQLGMCPWGMPLKPTSSQPPELFEEEIWLNRLVREACKGFNWS